MFRQSTASYEGIIVILVQHMQPKRRILFAGFKRETREARKQSAKEYHIFSKNLNNRPCFPMSRDRTTQPRTVAQGLLSSFQVFNPDPKIFYRIQNR